VEVNLWSCWVSDSLDDSEASSRVFLFQWCIVVDSPYRHNVLSKRMISLEAIKLHQTTLWSFHQKGTFGSFPLDSSIRGHIKNLLWHIPLLRHAYLHGVVMGISLLHHIHALHLHKSLHYHTPLFSMLLFFQLHMFYFHRSHVMFTHA